jgi:molecular chaperone GrpE (heat shock protein)
MNKKYYVNDGLKGDLLKILEMVPIKELIGVMRNRLPEYAASVSDISTIAAQAKLREGYEMALNDFMNIVHESPVAETPPADHVLFDPKD